MKIILIRHGKTKGNTEGRYIGETDENLCEEGINEIKNVPEIYADIVISSPMKRCIQTADIIFGKIDRISYDLRECSFGDFENKNYNELKTCLYYQKWLESQCKIPFPNGESLESFRKRCTRAFSEIIYSLKPNYEKKTIAFVIHGGSIMAICEKFEKPRKSFYERQIKNGEMLFFNTKYCGGELVLNNFA